MTKVYHDTRQESERTGIAEKTLSNWRGTGDGPPYLKIGGGRNARVLYDPEEVDKWLASHRVTSTSEVAA